MDPKQLDPKLKEAYDRVMGTSTTPPAANPPAAPVVNPSPAPEPIPSNPEPLTQTPFTPPQPVTPEPVVPNEPVTPQPAPAEPTTSVESKVQINGFVAADHQKKSGISPAIVILGVIVFLVVYSLFWIKFFGVSLPFLPQ